MLFSITNIAIKYINWPEAIPKNNDQTTLIPSLLVWDQTREALPYYWVSPYTIKTFNIFPKHERIRFTLYRKLLLYIFKFDKKLWAKKMNEYWRWNILNEAILDFPPQRMFKALNFLIQFPQHFAFTKHKFPRIS